jgi:hypothetical protein
MRCYPSPPLGGQDLFASLYYFWNRSICFYFIKGIFSISLIAHGSPKKELLGGFPAGKQGEDGYDLCGYIGQFHGIESRNQPKNKYHYAPEEKQAS